MCASGDQFGSLIGQRVEYQGFRSTVKFAGQLEGQKGIWIGVEWDDPSRGKHDGSLNGVQYFQTSHPTSGSFIRFEKLNFGISCVDAVRKRYGKVEGSTAGVDKEEIAELKRAFNVPFIEMVGFDKVNSQQSQFQNLKVVHLRSELINQAGGEGELASLCPSVKELILSDTLISSWKVIGDITIQLKELAHLDISDNKLPVPSEQETNELKSAFKSLHHIVLNNLGYSWKDILYCAKMWPCVTTLSVQSNKICDLESPPFELLSNLTTLYLQMNPIMEWAHVNKLGNLVSLQVLHLSETGVKQIFFPGDHTTSLFPSLNELYIQDNGIDNWSSIDELNKLASLKSLMLKSNPILDKPKAWDLIVARVQCLKKLNGTEVSDVERRGCEYDYLKFYGKEWLAAQNDPVLLRKFHNQHHQYSKLVQKYGFTMDDFSLKPLVPKSRLINVKIFCSKSLDQQEFQKKIPRNMTVQKLGGLVQKLIDTGDCVPSLHAISAKAPDVKILLDKDMQELSFYSVEDGDSIAVSW